jgi:hypothetical protein
MPPPVQQGGPPPIVGQHGTQQPYPQPPKKKSNVGKWVVGGVVALVVIAVAANSGDDSTKKSENASGTQKAETQNGQSKGDKQNSEANKDPEKPNNASDDYTPHVGPKEPVTVDGIVYSMRSVKQRKSIGDPQFGADEQASGMYLIVDITAHSTKGKSATLSDNTFKVTYDGGPEYSADTDGTVALQLSGADSGSEPFFLTDIQPDGDERGKVVFDVPEAAIGKNLELRVNELGFGSSHGFIRMP